MYIFDIFRSFLPLRNPIGFGASDFIAFAVAALLAGIVLAGPAIQPYAGWLAERTIWCMAALGVLPITLRLTLLIHNPIPTPSGADDFGYVLLGDTLAHFRLANAMHPMHRFFETIFVVQEPAYSAIYPLGQGMALAFGQVIFHEQWAGILLTSGAFCALCYWMLRAWVRPEWALLGGLLAVGEFGPLSYWMNSYWGGTVAAAAGCLVFGALPRLRESGRVRYAVLLGAGIGIQILTRPFEATLLALCAVLFFALAGGRRELARTTPVVLLAVLPAVALTLLQNKAVTGSWTTLPYVLSRYQYGVPPTFTFQPNPVPHRELTPDQELDYRAQAALHGDGRDTVGKFWARLIERVRFYRFFLMAPLYIACGVFIVCARTRERLWVIATLLLFSLGTNFYPYFFAHYIAAAACLFPLTAVAGLEKMHGGKARFLARIILLLCGAHFLFWYGFHLLGGDEWGTALSQYESWDYINYGDPEGRIAVGKQLAEAPGQQLVFVRYGPRHGFHSWIHNAADINGSRVVWARDLGDAEDEQLRRYYPERRAWLVEPDARPPRLTRMP